MKRGRSRRAINSSDEDEAPASQRSSQGRGRGSSQRGRSSQGPPRKIARKSLATQGSDSDSSSDEQPASQPASSQRGRRGGSSQASQSKRGGASQRGRGRGSTQGDDDEIEFTQRPVGKANLLNTSAEERETLVNALVRYCLLVDAEKKPIKRVDLTKHVLGEAYKKSQILSALIEVAQERLRQTMGMELVQIPKIVTAKDGHTTKKEASGTYILRSTLDKGVLAELVGDFMTPTQRAQRNLLMIVLSLIELNQGSYEQGELLKRLSKVQWEGLQHNDPDVQGPDWWEKLIKGDFLSQLWLERTKKKGTSGETTYEYTLGMRSKLEIGRLHIHEQIAKMFGDTIDPIKKKEVEEEMRLEAEQSSEESESGSD